MRLALRLHPNSLSFAATQLEVEVSRPRNSTLLLSYAVTGRMRDLQLPPVVATTRADELWRHTCFEAFLRTLPGAAYYEFNFAPSTQWAAYRFSSYRSRIRAASALPDTSARQKRSGPGLAESRTFYTSLGIRNGGVETDLACAGCCLP